MSYKILERANTMATIKLRNFFKENQEDMQ